MGDHLGVGVRSELGAGPDQLLFKLAEILDDPVVNHRDLLGHVRVGVSFDGLAVCRPARVADAGVTHQGLGRQSLGRLRNLPSARRRSSLPFSTVAMPAES